MRLRPDQLDRHLAAGRLAPVYAVSGEEPLQLEECLDAIRAAARASGCDDRVVLHADPVFDWSALAAERDALSLFASRKLIDLRVPSGRPGDDGSKALADYAARPNPDHVLLVSLPARVDTRSKWFRALAKAGVEIPVWPIEARALPAWVGRRAAAAGLTLTREAAELVAARGEGNLLACRQEIDKLRLLHGQGHVDADDVLAAVADSARFDAFDLVDAMLAGDTRRTVRVVAILRDEGLDLPQVVGALAWALRTVHAIATAVAAGKPLDSVLSHRRYGAWKRRRSALDRALSRHPPTAWVGLLAALGDVDCVAKGIGRRGVPPVRYRRGEAWMELRRVALAVAGVNILPASR